MRWSKYGRTVVNMDLDLTAASGGVEALSMIGCSELHGLSPRTGSRSTWEWVCIALLVVGLGCSPDPPSRLVRFIEEEPETPLESVRSSLFDLEPVFKWNFQKPQDLEPWRVVNINRFEVVRGELVVGSSSADPYFHRAADFDAADVQVLRVSMRGPANGVVQLFWARPGESFSRERSLLAKSASKGEYEFNTGTHMLWSGRITQLRLDPINKAQTNVRIREIAALRKRPNQTRLHNVVGQSFKVEIGQGECAA